MQILLIPLRLIAALFRLVFRMLFSIFRSVARGILFILSFSDDFVALIYNAFRRIISLPAEINRRHS